jgi:hypothetical protein
VTGNPYVLPAFILCLAALLGCAAWALLAITRQPGTGRHARARAASAEADQFVAELRGGVGCLPPAGQRAPLAEGWWNVPPPQPPAVEVLTGPGMQIPQTSAVTIGVLARVRDGLLPDAWRPEPGEVTFTPADADETRLDLQPVPDVIP